jgi:hypothetical protein
MDTSPETQAVAPKEVEEYEDTCSREGPGWWVPLTTRSHQISSLSSRHTHLPGTLHYIKIQFTSFLCYTFAHELPSPSLQSPSRHHHHYRPPPYHLLHYPRDSERCVVGCEDHQNRRGRLLHPVCDQREA